MTRSSAEELSAIQPRDLARSAAQHALTKKALDVVILDVSEISSVCDYFVICHGESDAQVRAILGAVEVGLESQGVRCWHVEGKGGKSWVLLDYVDVVVHIFRDDTRQYYRLEDLWADAPCEVIDPAAE